MNTIYLINVKRRFGKKNEKGLTFISERSVKNDQFLGLTKNYIYFRFISEKQWNWNNRNAKIRQILNVTIKEKKIDADSKEARRRKFSWLTVCKFFANYSNFKPMAYKQETGYCDFAEISIDGNHVRIKTVYEDLPENDFYAPVSKWFKIYFDADNNMEPYFLNAKRFGPGKPQYLHDFIKIKNCEKYFLPANILVWGFKEIEL